MLGTGTTRLALLGAVLAAALASARPAGAASPKLSCKIGKALTHVPARPVWFPVPQPRGTTLTVNADARPLFVHGLKWQVETRYFWLVRVPRGTNLGDPTAKLVFNARFDNLGRSVSVLRLSDGRLFTQWRTSGNGADTTAVVAKNITATEFAEFVASMRKVQYPTGC